jgi:hypothetical protein
MINDEKHCREHKAGSQQQETECRNYHTEPRPGAWILTAGLSQRQTAVDCGAQRIGQAFHESAQTRVRMGFERAD